MMDARWVLFRRYPAVIHAELAKSALQAYGVNAVVLGGTLEERPDFLDRSIDLMVKHADVERAREILGPEERFSD